MPCKETHLQAETDSNWKCDSDKDDGKYQQEDSETVLSTL